MENIPFYVSLTLALTALLTIFIFYKAAGNSRTVLFILFGWMTIQAVISKTGFYTNASSVPPRFLLTIGPPLLFIIFLFLTKQGRSFIDSLNLKVLTTLHIIRLPVELVLVWLFIHKAVPRIMTFEGHNFDILSGVTAPVIYYVVFIKNKSYKWLLVWNILCLALLINIVSIAILSAPFPFQKLGFEQPNIALLYFPFVWLPSGIVPLVLLSHLTAIKRLMHASNGKVKNKILSMPL